jgi:hypothetical protein
MSASELKPGSYLMHEATEAGTYTFRVSVRYLGRSLVIIPPSGYPHRPETMATGTTFERIEEH